MSRIKYPDDIIRSRRQSIEVAENLEIWADEDEFILELFKSERSVYKELADAGRGRVPDPRGRTCGFSRVRPD